MNAVEKHVVINLENLCSMVNGVKEEMTTASDIYLVKKISDYCAYLNNKLLIKTVLEV